MASSSNSAPGPSLRDRDLTQWLENKFGSQDDYWNKSVVSSLLNADILESLDSCFHDLQPNTKLRILFALIHCAPRTLEQCRDSARNIINLASKDTEDWVSTVAQLLQKYCDSLSMCFDLQHDDTHFARTLAELRRTVRERANEFGELTFLPPESIYLSQTAVSALCPESSVINQQSKTRNQRHFTLSRRPRSATVRAELLSKAAEASSQHKSKNPLIASVTSPNRHTIARKQHDVSVPLKPAPTANALKLSRGFSNEPKREHRPLIKREGGSKLIEIAETPQALRRKRKLWEAEQKEIKKQEKEQQKQRENEEKEQKRQEAIAARAAKQRARDEEKRAAAALKQESKQTDTSIVIKKAKLTKKDSTSESLSTEEMKSPDAELPDETAESEQAASSIILEPTPDYAAAAIVPTQRVGLLTHPPQLDDAANRSIHAPRIPAPTQPSLGTMPFSTVVRTPAPRNTIPHALAAAAATNQPTTTPNYVPTAAGTTGASGVFTQQHVTLGTASTMHAAGLPSLTTPPTTTQPQQQSQAPLTITRELMQQAQDMFRTANRLSRPEKALILGFMAGNRENPCPQMGNVLTVRLSETTTTETIEQGRPPINCAVETYFQMNYETGEWKRLRKIKPLPPPVAGEQTNVAPEQ